MTFLSSSAVLVPVLLLLLLLSPWHFAFASLFRVSGLSSLGEPGRTAVAETAEVAVVAVVLAEEGGFCLVSTGVFIVVVVAATAIIDCDGLGVAVEAVVGPLALPGVECAFVEDARSGFDVLRTGTAGVPVELPLTELDSGKLVVVGFAEFVLTVFVAVLERLE